MDARPSGLPGRPPSPTGRRRTKDPRALFEAQDEIESRKESLIAEVEARLKHTVEIRDIFTIGWDVV